MYVYQSASSVNTAMQHSRWDVLSIITACIIDHSIMAALEIKMGSVKRERRTVHGTGELHTHSVCCRIASQDTHWHTRVCVWVQVHGDSSFCLNLTDTQNPSGYSAQRVCLGVCVCLHLVQCIFAFQVRTLKAASKRKETVGEWGEFQQPWSLRQVQLPPQQFNV